MIRCMNAHKESKLDGFRKELEEWLTPKFEGGQGLTQLEAREELSKRGCSVSCSRLSDWWSARRSKIAEDKLIAQIATGAGTVKKVTRELEENPAPELETLIKLLRVLIMKFSAQANVEPAMIETLGMLLKPVLSWAKLQEHREDRAFELTKYADAMKSKLDLALDELAEGLKRHPDLMQEFSAWRGRLKERLKS